MLLGQNGQLYIIDRPLDWGINGDWRLLSNEFGVSLNGWNNNEYIMAGFSNYSCTGRWDLSSDISFQDHAITAQLNSYNDNADGCCVGPQGCEIYNNNIK